MDDKIGNALRLLSKKVFFYGLIVVNGFLILYLVQGVATAAVWQVFLGDRLGSSGTNGNAPDTVVRIKSKSGTVCGGVLLSARTVLTAAHCVDEATSYWVELPLLDVDTTSAASRRASASAEFSDVVSIKIHPKYDVRAHSGTDAALLSLGKALSFPDRAFKLSQSDGSFLGAALIAGFGSGGVGSQVSRARDLRMLPALYWQSSQEGTINAAKIDPPYTCYGDSGGPVFALDGTGSLAVIGIVSMASTYNGADHCVFGAKITSIAAMRPWLHDLNPALSYVGAVPGP